VSLASKISPEAVRPTRPIVAKVPIRAGRESEGSSRAAGGAFRRTKRAKGSGSATTRVRETSSWKPRQPFRRRIVASIARLTTTGKTGVKMLRTHAGSSRKQRPTAAARRAGDHHTRARSIRSRVGCGESPTTATRWPVIHFPIVRWKKVSDREKYRIPTQCSASISHGDSICQGVPARCCAAPGSNEDQVHINGMWTRERIHESSR
jgi:hypothetical protein